MKLLSRLIFFLILFTVAALFSGCEKKKEARISTSVRQEDAKPPVEEPAKELLITQKAFIEVSEKVTPAVVNIRAARLGRAGQIESLFDEFFGEFFQRDPRIRPQPEQSLGSGFILSKDGYILTNEHVVKGAEEINVRLSDRRNYQAKVVGVDPRTDVAVLKINPEEDLPTVVLGDSDKLQVGQWALAIGNPFGLDRTLTVGVISATKRRDIGIEDYEDFIQTDASINPGNSGGPLLNVYGEVIGINTAVVASGQGIGFAIPINLAHLVADQLIEKGEVVRGWLGVSIQPLTAELAESFGLDRVTGALVNQVLPGSPAEIAGLKQGDILLGFGGQEIEDIRELQLLVANTPTGKTVDVEVLREGKRMNLSVTVTERKPEKAAAAPSNEKSLRGLGLSVAPTKTGEGVQVASVNPESPAAKAGVRPGDVILSVNRRNVDDPESFRNAVEKTEKNRNVVFLIRRGENTLYLAFPVS